MIVEHPLVLETNHRPAQGAVRQVANGQARNSRFHALGAERGSFELEQPVRIAWPDSEFGEAADQHDLERLIAGVDQALQSLMKRHSETLYFQLLRMLRDKRDAQDSLLEAFVRVYLHREEFDFAHRFSTWLYAIAFNLARDYLRRRSRQPEFISLDDRTGQENGDLEETLLDPHRTPDQEMENQERLVSLGKALKSLPDCLREPLMLFALEEKSQPQLAAQMQCSIKAVEMRLYHARKRLHDVLGKEFRENEGFGFLRRNSS